MKQVILMLAALALTGCFDYVSLHPLADDATTITDPALVGVWEEPKDKDRIHFATRESKHYEMWIEDWNKDQKRYKETFRTLCKLVKLGDALYLDLSQEPDKETAIKGHAVIRIQLSGNSLKTASLEAKWMDAQLRRKALAHQRILMNKERKEYRTILSASTPALQAFYRKHARTPGAFGEWELYERVPAPTR